MDTQLFDQDSVAGAGAARARLSPDEAVLKRLLVINGHPDPRPERYCNALCNAYVEGAVAAGWETRRLNAGQLPMAAIENLKNGNAPGSDVSAVLRQIGWANRLAVIYPLWFDRPPEVLRGLFAARAVEAAAGRRAHFVVSMDMPAFAYRSMLRPGSGSVPPTLDLAGLEPDEPVLIGSVSSLTDTQRRAWLDDMRRYGRGWLGASVTPGWSLAAMLDRTMHQLGLQ